MSKIAVSIAEAASLASLGKTSIYKLIADGKLAPHKLGKRTIVLVSDLESLLKSLPTAL